MGAFLKEILVRTSSLMQSEFILEKKMKIVFLIEMK